MDRSRIIRNSLLPTEIVSFDLSKDTPHDVVPVIERGGLVAFDNVPWLKTLPKQQEWKVRRFGQPFSKKEEKLSDDVYEMLDAVKEFFTSLFPTLVAPVETRKSFRPMISCGEPLHYDTFYRDGHRAITAYANLSDHPRYYSVSFTFPELMKRHEHLVLKTVGDGKGSVLKTRSEVVSLLRDRGRLNLGPLCDDIAMKHFIAFAPRSIWIFDPFELSHELLYGECAMCYSWISPVVEDQSKFTYSFVRRKK